MCLVSAPPFQNCYRERGPFWRGTWIGGSAIRHDIRSSTIATLYSGRALSQEPNTLATVVCQTQDTNDGSRTSKRSDNRRTLCMLPHVQHTPKPPPQAHSPTAQNRPQVVASRCLSLHEASQRTSVRTLPCECAGPLQPFTATVFGALRNGHAFADSRQDPGCSIRHGSLGNVDAAPPSIGEMEALLDSRSFFFLGGWGVRGCCFRYFE